MTGADFIWEFLLCFTLPFISAIAELNGKEEQLYKDIEDTFDYTKQNILEQ